MMRPILFIFFFLIGWNCTSQTNFNGVWQGIMVKDGFKNAQGTIFYTFFTVNNGIVEGKTRDEVYNTDQFAVKKIKGSVKNNVIQFNQIVIEKKKNNSTTNWCNIDASLTYNDSTGYLEGKYTSTDCKRNTGKIILYRSTAKFSATEESMLAHNWMKFFLNNLRG